jgi:small subunit ribosomal protein S16
VVVTDHTRPRDGQYLETIGVYNPRTKPAQLRLDLVKVEQWVGQGARLSDTVASLVRKARKGGDDSVAYKPLVAEGVAEAAAGESAE